ncbi:hypothetical protein [Rathayibacter sp. Leaf296]|uniref:hypothetical protein n=1 Tax=Rathayibacter sp. Leaf296 TaxID=1736327 RepID=UPI0007032D11|nr:hypothetical protein [Rathayibacter sp. Leaf296]KQQ11276.1 hypothetical protein ASF46_10140 [Rathayibacter sp. Leaf296]
MIALEDVARASPIELIEYLHANLDAHFTALAVRRANLELPAPVFALEHGLSVNDRKLLTRAVGDAHRLGLMPAASRNSWLPFVVHAAEVGYIYDGVEYWPIYASKTLRWADSDYERDRVRNWFVKFSQQYGGAIPQGAWARTFSKIAWPITHAVLPRYLQVQLARMLSDYRASWPSLLDDPSALGTRLHAWSRYYGDRLEKFCQNTEIVGRLAVALLITDEHTDSPLIESTALARIVESLNSERQSRRWLLEARRSASSIRTHNFRPPDAQEDLTRLRPRRPATTDPPLQLREDAGGLWRAFAILPDLRPLQHAMPRLYEALRNSRAVVAGARQEIPTSGLLYATSPIELTRWPAPPQPFLQLRRASDEVNLLLAEQCRITQGPWWVFRQKPGAPAGEVKGKFVRPGATYCILGDQALSPPALDWCVKVDIALEGMSAYVLSVPATLSEADAAALVEAGISLVSDIRVRPVGVVAGRWDGDGIAEWLSGESVLIAIHAEHSPKKVGLHINGDPYLLDWPEGESELFLSLGELAAGTHEIVVSVDPNGENPKTEGSLLAIIRDPDVHSEAGLAGEGIRLRSFPAQPSLPELWDGRALLEIDGPSDAGAELALTLRGGGGAQLAIHRQNLRLPVTGSDWQRLVVRLREQPQIARHYDAADTAELAVSKAGVGFATLRCERGFQGLRWVISRRHRDNGYIARLIDRTDGDPVDVVFYPVERPLSGQPQPADQDFSGPPRGGLLVASNDQDRALQIIPPDATQLIAAGDATPSIPTTQKSLVECTRLMKGHQLWKNAQLPAHPFGVRERRRVLDAITGALVGLLTPGKWVSLEGQIATRAAADVDLDRAQTLVGERPVHRAAAQAIANHLWEWDTRALLIEGFSEAAGALISSSGMPNKLKGARFLLQLASSPSELLEWETGERNEYLRAVMTDPVLVRAARFAVLGTVEEVAGGVG